MFVFDLPNKLFRTYRPNDFYSFLMEVDKINDDYKYANIGWDWLSWSKNLKTLNLKWKVKLKKSENKLLIVFKF